VRLDGEIKVSDGNKIRYKQRKVSGSSSIVISGYYVKIEESYLAKSTPLDSNNDIYAWQVYCSDI
jgi:hypothetical protein